MGIVGHLIAAHVQLLEYSCQGAGTRPVHASLECCVAQTPGHSGVLPGLSFTHPYRYRKIHPFDATVRT